MNHPILFLAEAAPSGAQWNGFLTAVSFLAFVVVNIVTTVVLLRKHKTEVRFGFEPASKAEFDRQAAANEQVHRDLFSKIGGVERGAKQHTDNNTELLRGEIIVMGKCVAGLERETLNQNKWLERIDKKLDDRTT